MKKLRALALVLAVGATAAAIATAGNARVKEKAAPAAAGKAQIACGKTRTMGLLAPLTGPAASIGQQQNRWFDYFIKTYNRTHKTKLKAIKEDTMLGAPSGTAEALKGAQALGSNSKVLGVVGPAGSNETKGVTPTLKGAGFAYVSGSATAIILTNGTVNDRGFFFRTVPTDAVQGKTAANYMLTKMKVKRVYIIDDQEAYSTGLADQVQSRLKAKGISVERDGINQQQSSFSSLIAKIARNTDVIYIPWQLVDQAKPFVQQLKQAGKGSIKVMGADGLYDPSFAAQGKSVYDSSLPVDPKTKLVKGYLKANGGHGDYFGAPTYAAAQVIAGAIDRACKNGSASRAEVRAQAKKTRIAKTANPTGMTIRFNAAGDIAGGGRFGLYKSNGKEFVPVG